MGNKDISAKKVEVTLSSLRGYQKEIIRYLDEMDEQQKGFSTIVSVPTGGGKTRIALEFLLPKLQKKGNKVLWIANRVDLLRQSAEKMQELLSTRDSKYQFICTDINNNEQENNKQVVSASLDNIKSETDIAFVSAQSLLMKVDDETENNIRNCTQFRDWMKSAELKMYIIYDEAHHILSSKMEDVLRIFFDDDEKAGYQIKNYGLIGLTATVYRGNGEEYWTEFGRWFKDGVSEDKTGKYKIVHDSSSMGSKLNNEQSYKIEIVDIHDLIKRGYLEKPDIYRVDDFKKGKPNNDDEIKYLADRIKEHYRKDNWGKTIVFVRDTKFAKQLQGKLSENSVECFAYTSNTNWNDDDLKDFKKVDGKNYKLMIAVDMVSEGFDVKDLQTVYLYSKVRSQIKLRQRVGRVLRTHESKQQCRVIWQKYFDSEDDLPKGSTICHDGWEKPEEEIEIQRDIAEFQKCGNQIPAGMAFEPLPRNSDELKKIYERLEFLEILDLFGTEPWTENNTPIRRYDLDDGKYIYCRKSETKGYEQFFEMIMVDYYAGLRFVSKCNSISGYASYLHREKKNDLLEYIKKECFYMSNIRKTDAEGKIAKKRMAVLDDDLTAFYEYVIENRKMPSFKDIPEKESKTSSDDDKDDDLITDNLFKKYIQEHGLNEAEKTDDIREAMKVHSQIITAIKGNKVKTKTYPEILAYGKFWQFQYQEMKSARYIMNMGASPYKNRIRGYYKGVEGVVAFLGKEGNKIFEISPEIVRTTNKIGDGDTLLIAQALITVPNHIATKVDDVKNYEAAIKEVAKSYFNYSSNVDDNQLAYELLMALGYKASVSDGENEKIIRMQVSMFDDKLPRLLQYVIYCRCYENLSKKVKFIKNDVLVHECQNTKELDQIYKDNLKKYGVKTLDADLTPVEDVINDYRPYLELTPYYQGKKPEYLCRMINQMLMLSPKPYNRFLDAFGGSGTVTLNIQCSKNKPNLKLIYNDYGIMNESILKSIQKDGGEKLKEMINNFINLIFIEEDETYEKAAMQFFEPYEGILQDKEKTKYDFSEKRMRYHTIEQTYRKNSNKNIDDALTPRRKNYNNIYKAIAKSSNKDFMSEIQRLEEHLLPLIIEIYNLFHAILGKNDNKLSNEQLGFIFFIYNSFISRKAYYNATINHIENFICNYEKWIDSCTSIISNIGIKRGDAISLLRQKNNADEVCYCDIPYEETDDSNYSNSINVDELWDALGKSEEDYIVASRINIIEKDEEDNDKAKKFIRDRRVAILRFYNGFASESIASQYKDFLKKYYPPKDKVTGKNKKYTQIKSGREAKYILFSFTRRGTSFDENKNHSRNNAILSNDDEIRRVLEHIQFSDNPVEMMLTNMDLDLSKMPIVELKKDKIWYLPTFLSKSDEVYHVEPVTIIMKYNIFMNDFLLRIIASDKIDVINSIDSANIAASLRKYYKEHNSIV